MNSSGYPGIGRLAYVCVQAILSAYNPTEPTWLIPILDFWEYHPRRPAAPKHWRRRHLDYSFINILLMLSCAVLPPGYRYHRLIDRIGGVLIAALAGVATILIAIAIFGRPNESTL